MCFRTTQLLTPKWDREPRNENITNFLHIKLSARPNVPSNI